MGTTRTALSATLALLFLAALVGAAQDKPPFTGTWTRIEPALSPDERDLEQIDQHDNVLRIRFERSGSAGTLGYGFSDDRTYTIGGPIESKTDTEGRVRTVGVHWESPNLVFVRTTVEGANTTTEREVWSASDDGTRLTKERQTTDWRGTRNERVVFERTSMKLRR
jgi:hypothetical protein